MLLRGWSRPSPVTLPGSMNSVSSKPRLRLPWPLPALACWLAGWAVFAMLLPAGAAVAVPAATAAGVAAAWRVDGRWRRLIAGGGFPVSALALVPASAWPSWVWPLAATTLLVAYPLRAWRDAPFFPTPADALEGLAQAAPVADGGRVLDAGCGAGHALLALRGAYPHARLEGVEWSRPLAWLSALRCPTASVRRGDMWSVDWSGCAMVYLFQRPESMPRAAAKAAGEMRDGAWLVSLEFPVPGWTAHASLQRSGCRPVWIYRIGRHPALMPSIIGRRRR